MGIYLVAALSSVTAFAYDYTLDQYTINIKVNENNTLDITENINAQFAVPKHGIYRKIPLRNDIHRLDGTNASNRAKITNLSANEHVSTSSEVNNEVPYTLIKLGHPNKIVYGARNYTLRYTYNLGKDTGIGYDEFYFNLIGPEWENTEIKGVNFTIDMPKAFDATKLGFSVGKLNSTANTGITYSVEDNRITGQYAGTLHSGEALTARLELPEGYFVDASNNIDVIQIFALTVPLVSLCITFIFWFKYGRGPNPVEVLGFYPPEGFNSAETGFLYKGQNDDENIVSLIVYLANKGYLKIVEANKADALGLELEGFKLIKLKEYEENNPTENLFFKGLFGNQQTVTPDELKDYFYTVLNHIKLSMSTQENLQAIFDQRSLQKGSYTLKLILISFLFIVFPLVTATNFVFLVFFIFFITIVSSYTFSAVKKIPQLQTGSLFIVISLFIFISLFIGLPTLLLIALIWPLMDPLYIKIGISGVICIILMLTLRMRMVSKRSPYGNDLLGKIKGFKRFLDIVEKDRLEKLVMQDPSYFYDILPYAYVLGTSDVWIKKFETIITTAPTWYESPYTFHFSSFDNFIHTTMTAATIAASKPAQTSTTSGRTGFSSRHSGGGSSGRGSGGGGGGAW